MVISMAKISISLPDELVQYVDDHVENRSALIENLLKRWQEYQENLALASACAAVDELNLGWDQEWQNAAISDWEASG
jgi:antitoxin ParD1/3/4